MGTDTATGTRTSRPLARAATTTATPTSAPGSSSLATVAPTPAATTESTAHTARTEQVQQLQQLRDVTSTTLTSTPQTTQLEVALHPAELGAVRVSVAMHHGALDVTVACADPATRDAATAALPDLQRALSQTPAAGHTATRDDGAAPDGRPQQQPSDERPRRDTTSDDSFEPDQSFDPGMPR